MLTSRQVWLRCHALRTACQAVTIVPRVAAPPDADARFEHFKRQLWPRIKEAGGGGGTLIYLPSYFDYVR